MRVMRILTRPNVGGPTVQAASLFHAHAALGVDTLLVVGRCGADEAAVDLEALGVPRCRADAIGPAMRGFVEVAELGNRWSPAGTRVVLRRLLALMRAFAPEVVHTHTSRAGWLGRRAAGRAAVPVVAHTFHGHVLRDYFGPLRSWLLGRLERALARRSDLLFAVSPSCADELAALGVAPRARFSVVPPAVPLPTFVPRAAARRELGIADDEWAVACLGRLVPIKRVDRFVAAVGQLPACRGHVHGDGPLANALARAAAAAGNVTLHPSSARVRELLAAYDALVLPSRREGCPLVAVEAFAAGVPVVGHDVPGVRDALTTWGQGLTVPDAAGAAGIAVALQRLRREPELQRTLVAAGRAALPRFHPDAVARQLLAAYREALAARGGYDARSPD